MAYTVPRLQKTTINSVDVSDYIIKWNCEEQYKISIGSATIMLSSKASSVLTLDETLNGKSVLIQRGVSSATEINIFRGEVVKVEPDGSNYIITCKDKYYQAVRNEVTKTYDINIDSENGVGSEIFKDLVTTYTDDLVADSTTVQSTGTTFKITKFKCNHADTYERCDTIAITYDWQHYYDSRTDKVYFEPKGYIDTGETLTVGVEIVEVPKWKFDKSALINELTVIGAEQLVSDTEYFSGDGSEANFELQYTPVNVKVYVGSGSYSPSGSPATRPSDTDANLKIGGKVGSSSEDYDYTYDPDENIKSIDFDSGSIPASGTNNIEVQYTHNLPIPVVVRDEKSITDYKLHKTTLFKPELKNINDAELYANNQVEHFKSPLASTVLKVVSASDLQRGRKITVVDNVNNVTKTLVITKIKFSYPYRHDIIEVGENPLIEANWELMMYDRVSKLEEQNNQSQDLLLHVFSFEKDIDIFRESHEVKRYKICDSFIVGHPVNGLIGMGTALEDMDGTTSWISIQYCTPTYSSEQFLVGTQSTKLVQTGGSYMQIRSDTNHGNLSAYTGVNSGTPTQGTIGLWLYTDSPTSITSLEFLFGSDSSNFMLYNDSIYAYKSVNGYENWSNLSFQIQAGWNYLLVDLDNPNAVAGTPDWTNTDFKRIRIYTSSSITVYLDYITISKSNYIGLNGVGIRRMEIN